MEPGSSSSSSTMIASTARFPHLLRVPGPGTGTTGSPKPRTSWRKLQKEQPASPAWRPCRVNSCQDSAQVPCPPGSPAQPTPLLGSCPDPQDHRELLNKQVSRLPLPAHHPLAHQRTAGPGTRTEGKNPNPAASPSTPPRHFQWGTVGRGLASQGSRSSMWTTGHAARSETASRTQGGAGGHRMRPCLGDHADPPGCWPWMVMPQHLQPPRSAWGGVTAEAWTYSRLTLLGAQLSSHQKER